MEKVIIQKWEESERGWGVRPDGFSAHLTDADRVAFIEKHWNSMPPQVPDEYDRPAGVAYWVEVDQDTYAKVKAAGLGIRFYQAPPAGKVWITKGSEAKA